MGILLTVWMKILPCTAGQDALCPRINWKLFAGSGICTARRKVCRCTGASTTLPSGPSVQCGGESKELWQGTGHALTLRKTYVVVIKKKCYNINADDISAGNIEAI